MPALFMLAAAWTLQVDGHVRVDIFYAQARPRTRALIDLIGARRLPVAVRGRARGCCRCLMSSAPGRFLNGSREASGLPFVYLLKTLIPLFALLIGLQGVAQAIRAALVLSGRAAPRVEPMSEIARRRDGGGGLRAAARRAIRWR